MYDTILKFLTPQLLYSRWHICPTFHFFLLFHYTLSFCFLYFALPFCLQDDGAEPPRWRDEDSGPPGRGRLCQQEPPWLQTGLGLPTSQLAHHDQEVSQPRHAYAVHLQLCDSQECFTLLKYFLIQALLKFEITSSCRHLNHVRLNFCIFLTVECWGSVTPLFWKKTTFFGFC